MENASSSLQKDQDCAFLARTALFPARLHRDVADDSHFPALLQLDLLRHSVLTGTSNSSISLLFPRHVVVVRNVSSGGIQWNGNPDYDDPRKVSFPVIPNKVSVSCTSNCDALLESKSRKAFHRKGGEIVLCSDRILKESLPELKYRDVRTEELISSNSYHAVEEVLAHELVKVRISHRREESKPSTSRDAELEVLAARAAECYYSKHRYDGRTKIRKGSLLHTGYSLLPLNLQKWSKENCVADVATKNMQTTHPNLSKGEVKEAVRKELKSQSTNGKTSSNSLF